MLSPKPIPIDPDDDGMTVGATRMSNLFYFFMLRSALESADRMVHIPCVVNAAVHTARCRGLLSSDDDLANPAKIRVWGKANAVSKIPQRRDAR